MLLFDDGFELGNLAARTSVRTGADGTAGVQGTTVKTGSQAARLSASANSGSYAYAHKELPSSETDLSVSANVRDEQEGASGGHVPLLRLYDAAGTRQVSLYRQNLGGDLIRVHAAAGTPRRPASRSTSGRVYASTR